TGASAPPFASAPTVTYYLYDALSNLKQATAKSTPECDRTYVYDSFSRMTQSKEPEPGVNGCTDASHTTNYYYTQANGTSLCSGDPMALCRRTDGRGITTTYTYEALNRLSGISYTGTTPAVAYS